VKYISTYKLFEGRKEETDLVKTIRDICLDIQDDGFEIKLSYMNLDMMGETYLKIWKENGGEFSVSEKLFPSLKDTLDRLSNLLDGKLKIKEYKRDSRLQWIGSLEIKFDNNDNY
jgi:hypothetical protein